MVEKIPHQFLTQYEKVSFYIVAHADDWQLFMNPHVFNDLTTPSCKVIFIITTAGDAGISNEYWLAREEGLRSSIRFCLAPIAKLLESNRDSLFNEHKFFHCSINTTTTY